MINGRTRLVGLIGWPVRHSLSPPMHNAAFAKLGLNWCYVPLPAAPERLEEAVKGLTALGFAGANVTAPHKQRVMVHVDEMASEVRAVGAVNTIVVREGRTIGFNTDGWGFLAALQESRFAPQGKRVVVLGAGGAARAVVHALAEAGSKVLILNRTPERAKSLVEALSPSCPSASLAALPLTLETLSLQATAADLLVNATSVGTWPEVDQCPWPDDLALPSRLTVFDLVYSPPQTKLLQRAASVGARTIGGLGMLVHQGAAAFRLWTGVEPPLETMYEACHQVLGGERCCAF